MAPKKDKDKPPEFMTISGQVCRRVKDSNGKIVYRPVQGDGSDATAQAKPKNDEEEEKKWIQMKEREVQEARLRDARQHNAKQLREKEKMGLVEKSGRSREPTLKVPVTLQRLRDEHEAALKVGMSTSKPGEYILLKEALDIEEKRFQAKVKEAKEKAYKRTRGKLRVGGRAGIDDSDGDLDEEDVALIPKQELHDIDDYRRDLPVSKPSMERGASQPTLWSANGQAAASGHASHQKQDTDKSRPGSARHGRGRGRGGHAPRPAPVKDSVDVSGLCDSFSDLDTKTSSGLRVGHGGGNRGAGRNRGSRGGGSHAQSELVSDAASSNGHGGRVGRSRSGNRGKGRGRGEAGREQNAGQTAVVNAAG